MGVVGPVQVYDFCATSMPHANKTLIHSQWLWDDCCPPLAAMTGPAESSHATGQERTLSLRSAVVQGTAWLHAGSERRLGFLYKNKTRLMFPTSSRGRLVVLVASRSGHSTFIHLISQSGAEMTSSRHCESFRLLFQQEIGLEQQSLCSTCNSV